MTQSSSAQSPIEITPLSKRYNLPVFIIPLLFLVLLTATHIVNQAAFARQTSIASLVNIAGEQKLLTSSISSTARDIQLAQNDAGRVQSQQIMTTLLDDWAQSHQSLSLDTTNSIITELLSGITPNFNAIQTAARCLATPQTTISCTDTPESYVASILANESGYVQGLDHIATEYRIEETNGVSQAITISWLFFIATIIALVLVGYFVLRPAAKRQIETLDQLAGSRMSLEFSTAEAEARSVELRTVADISTQVSSILEVDRLLQEVSDLTKEHLQLYHAHIYLLDEDGNTLVLTAGAGILGRQMVTEKRSIALDNPDSIVATAARNRQSVSVNDVHSVSTFLSHPLLPDTRSELAIPLVARAQLLGVLDIQSNTTNYFTESKASVIELMAGQVAVAISNARLYEASESISFRERALGSLDREIQGAVSMDEILRTTTRELAKSLGVSETAVELKLAEKRLASKTWGGHLISTAEMQRLDADGDSQKIVPQIDQRNASVAPQLVNPIMIRGTKIGSITIKNDGSFQLGADDKELVQDTARLVAQALDQFRSIEEIRRSEENARAAQQFLDSIIENIPNMVFVKDAEELRFVSFNKAGEDLLGIKRESMIGKSDFDFFPTDEAEWFIDKDREVLKSKNLLDIPEELIKTADGDSRILHTKKIPILDAQGTAQFLLGISEDITDRKQAQTALIESERRYRQIVEEATDVVYTIDPAGFFTFASPSAQRLTGFAPGELIGTHFTDLLPKGEGWRKRLVEFYLKQVEQKIPQTSLEFPILTREGERRWLEQQVTLTTQGDNIIGLQSVARDITERVLQDEIIRESRVRAELLGLVNAALSQSTTEDEILTAVSVVVIERNLHHAFLAYVESDDSYRISSAEIIALYSGFGEPLPLEATASTQLPEAYYSITSKWSDGLQTPLYIEDIQTLDEASRSYFLSENIAALVLVPLRTSDEWQAIVCYVWSEPQTFPLDFRDMIESMMPTAASVVASRRAYLRTQVAREQAERRSLNMEAVAQVSATATTILDTDELLKSVSNLTRDRFRLYHAHVYLLDETGDKLILAAGAGEAGDFMKSRGHFIPYDRQSSLVAQAARERHAVIANDVTLTPEFLPNPLLPETRSELALPMIVADKLVGVLDVQHNTVNRFNDEDIRVLTALTNQVAVAVENSNAFREQQKTAERLREVDRLKSQFLANMSHELRTPLNSIIGYSELLLDGIDGELNDEVIEDVQAIYGGGKHLLSIINDVLDLAKIEAGQMLIESQAIDIMDVIKDVLDTCNILARNKGLELKVQLQHEIPLVSGDAIRLKQIILNLVNNAIKFTSDGSITLDLALDDQDMVKVSIIDTGMGMTSDEMQGLFQQFNQVDNSPTRRAGGTGLGLVITRHLVTMHGGVVDVESEKDIGSTFWFTIPTFNQQTLSSVKS